MPYAQTCTFLSGPVTQVDSCRQLSAQQGFVMAPFAPSAAEPILVIQPAERQTVQLVDGKLEWGGDLPLPLQSQTSLLHDVLTGTADTDERACYHHDFQTFFTELRNTHYQKLVLSRSTVLERNRQTPPLELFLSACNAYPRLFIALVYTPQSGCWLAATPETLLAGSDTQWETVALAGTMAWDEQLQKGTTDGQQLWSAKNRQEQRYVATYITEQLQLFTSHIQEEGPYTVKAGHLAHLRSDFHFTLPEASLMGRLLATLHPTPAVCGLPKQAAFRFIQQHEHQCRSYYSGFLGPLAVERHTHLFVTLRCMRLYANAYQLYAGGGLLQDSEEEQEWLETESKLDTMRHILSL